MHADDLYKKIGLFRMPSFTWSIPLIIFLAACSGGGGGGSPAPAPPPTPAPTTYTIAGTVSGLQGSGLALSLSGGTSMPVTASGSFTFPTQVASGAAYAVTVVTQPSGPAQTCNVTKGTGTVASANVTSVVVDCTAAVATIGGTLAGLRGAGLQLKNNAGDALSVAANGSFTFATALPLGASYNVSVSTDPRAPKQTCAVTNGSGIASTNVTSVLIDCALNTGNLRTFIPAPSYSFGSGEHLTFTSINSARSGSHFGLLAQSTMLDTAARAHAQYVATHFYSASANRFDPNSLSAGTAASVVRAHFEEVGETGFTGNLPADRAWFAGYPWIDGAEGTVVNAGIGSRDCSDQILDSVVLRQKMMNTEMRDMGVGIAETADGKGFVCVVLAAYGDFRGEAPAGWVGVYPFDNAAQIFLAMASDITGETFGVNRGEPILFMADRDAVLAMTSVTFKKTSTAVNIAAMTITSATLPADVTPNQILVVPSQYLERNTNYTVRFVGTVDGLQIDQATAFTTGRTSRSAPFTGSPAPGTMRTVYAFPTDRTNSLEYRAGIRMAIEHLQGWYQQQLGGETFGIYDPEPQVCALSQPSSYYVDNTWDKIQADVQVCAPVKFGDPDYDWIVYADVVHGCNLPGRLGAGTNTLTMLPREDLEGLVGRDTGVDACGGQFPLFPPLRFVGGLGHEVGHTLGLPHPPGCEASAATCDAQSLMWQGVYSYPVAHFSATERSSLLLHRFINLQRFGR